MNERYPLLYENALCINCNIYRKTLVHALTCDKRIEELRKEYLKIISKKLRKIHNDAKTKEIIKKEFKNHSDYSIDHNRTHTVKTVQVSPFSFIDIIRNLIPKSLKKILKKYLKIEKKEIDNIILEIMQELTKIMHNKWIIRCEKMSKWEENKEITHEQKRNTKTQYTRYEGDENYKRIKSKLEA